MSTPALLAVKNLVKNLCSKNESKLQQIKLRKHHHNFWNKILFSEELKILAKFFFLKLTVSANEKFPSKDCKIHANPKYKNFRFKNKRQVSKPWFDFTH